MLIIITIFLALAVVVCFFSVTNFIERKLFGHPSKWILSVAMLVFAALLGGFLSPTLGEITVLPAWGWNLTIFFSSAAVILRGY